VRNYKRKGKTPWPDKNKRMAAAARKRAEGKSLREIAKDLGVTHPTVLADLRKWDELHPNVVSLPVNRAGKSYPAGGEIYQPDLPLGDSLPKLRRIQ
jgi:predicted transcriptional regulator